LGGIHHPFLDPTNGKNEWPSESDEPKYHFLVLIELKKKTASSEKRVNKMNAIRHLTNSGHVADPENLI
jgi:hypothetical protein